MWAPLLPKLRGHFAEFLNHSSPERLSILYLTTCVGLGYGPNMHSLEAFLDSTGSQNSPQKGYASRLELICQADLPTQRSTRLHHNPISGSCYLTASPHHLATTRSGPTHATTTNPKVRQWSYGWLVSLIHHGRAYSGTGISTRYPSTTPVGLALGPDSPWED